MKALRFPGNGQPLIEDMPVPEIKPGEVLIKVAISAICGSERGDYLRGCNFISGHEFAGTAEKVNNCRIISPGMRVTVNVIKGCGECVYCKTGLPQLCRNMTGISGGHAEYAAVPESCCIPLPDEIPWDAGVLLGGDTLGVAHRVSRRLPVDYGRFALVSGAGPIGLGVSALLKYYGYHVAVVEPGAWRRENVKKAIGVDESWDPASDNVAEQVDKLSGGTGADVVIECSGNPEGQKNALAWVKPAGTVILCGENYKELSIIPSVSIIHREVTLTGVFYFTTDDFCKLLLLYRRGLDPLKTVSHRFPLDKAPEACKLFFSGEAGKVLLYR
jgi:threonine dehydrogenase-like Zn-dependent dehydrogenase